MNEFFLHYLWQFQLFSPTRLRTTDGTSIAVLRPGLPNEHAGPDFFNARIRIGNTEWAGNVELHMQSSEWERHRHHLDPAYHNVILHVVYQHDKEIEINGNPLPTLVLAPLIKASLILKYRALMQSRRWLPCQQQIERVHPIVILNWQTRLLIERLQRRSALITERLIYNKFNWEETFYQFMAGNFGFKVNSLPFDMLAASLPLKYLARHKNDVFQLEALLFGQAGFLNSSFEDTFPSELKKEYEVLSRKFSLQAIDFHIWKFFRLRPVNFPSVRIAQFASLIHRSARLFSRILEAEEVTELKGLFQVRASGYWDNHYLFDQPSPSYTKNLGKESIDNLIINTVIPFLFAYGSKKDIQQYKERALYFLEKLSAEKNTVVHRWKKLKIDIRSAFQSQAMIELKNSYCSQKKCLNCAIGKSILKEEK